MPALLDSLERLQRGESLSATIRATVQTIRRTVSTVVIVIARSQVAVADVVASLEGGQLAAVVVPRLHPGLLGEVGQR